MKLFRSGIVVTLVCTALPAWADTQFRARKMTRNDVPLDKGQCDIRLMVDDEVEVTVRGDLVNVRTLRGRDARDDGSECNEPLPNRRPEDFNFEKRDGRGEIRLIGEPSRQTDYQAIVRIRDSEGGEGRYHFRLSWRVTGNRDFHETGRRDEDDRRDRPDREDDFRRGGLTWNNAFHSGGPGRGSSQLTGYGSQRLSDANVDIDRGGRLMVSFRTDSGRPLAFSGTMMAPEGEVLKAAVTSDDRADLRGPMYLSRDARGTVYRITLDATNGQDRLHLEWDRR